MIFILSFIILLYCVAITLLIYGFSKINSFEYTSATPKTKFTIIVPFRNEAENLPVLLDSFSKLNYPNELIEILLVDDDSSDGFSLSVSSQAKWKNNIQIIQNIRVSNSPKKDAIQTAMHHVKTNWIITTDADCIVNANWLMTLDNYIQFHDVSMLVGAVTYDCKNSFLHHFQQLDLASLQGATIGSFGIQKGFMCNGANLAYTKSLFEAVNGFDGNTKIASGDDVFLLQKAIAQFPEKVHYLKSKNNIVSTKLSNNWKSLFYQRVRWASKTTSYQSTFGKMLGLTVFFGNLSWIALLGFLIFVPFPLAIVIFLVVLKFTIDALLIYKANDFLTTAKIRYLIWSSFFYPLFSVSVAFYSLFGKYEWKGRKF